MFDFNVIVSFNRIENLDQIEIRSPERASNRINFPELYCVLPPDHRKIDDDFILRETPRTGLISRRRRTRARRLFSFIEQCSLGRRWDPHGRHLVRAEDPRPGTRLRADRQHHRARAVRHARDVRGLRRHHCRAGTRQRVGAVRRRHDLDLHVEPGRHVRRRLRGDRGGRRVQPHAPAEPQGVLLPDRRGADLRRGR